MQKLYKELEGKIQKEKKKNASEKNINVNANVDKEINMRASTRKQ